MVTILFVSVSGNVTAKTNDHDIVECGGVEVLFTKTIDLSDTSTDKLCFINNTDDGATVCLSISPQDGSPIRGNVDKRSFIIGPHKDEYITLTFDVDRTSKYGTYTTDVIVKKLDCDSTEHCIKICTYNVKLTPAYFSNDPYNKILGVFNPLSEPLNTVSITSAITIIIWMGISLVTYKTLHFVTCKAINNAKFSSKISRRAGVLLTVPVVMYGFANALAVYGAEKMTVTWLLRASSFFYIPIIAFIVWGIYANAVSAIFYKMKLQNKIIDADTSLIPLFNIIGKIIISVCAISAILKAFGYDLMAIITGAGIAGMAISLGAQNIFTEFFSGINLRTTRLFKRGDMVKIGTDNDIYEVEEIGLMNCRFKNWTNLERVIIPNSTVFSNFVVNITEETRAYRIFLHYTVSYDSDLKKVRQILMESACNHPKVIIDGSYSPPDVSLTSFKDSAIEYCLAVYIADFRDNISVADELNESVYKNLRASGIEIPYNKLDVYITGHEKYS
ncbi:MAG: mechanosensitive ion channel [archaeon]|nr:mechanosensitive ion channel [archaeon]